MNNETGGKLGILVGGGPAPGINSVISAATIRAILENVEVVGLRDGFEWVMQGRTDRSKTLTIQDVSRIHFRGGSFLGISRANPTKNPELLETTVRTLLEMGVTRLVTIGGDDTAFSAMKLEERAAGRIQVAHVPKTIDNDLSLPASIDTFGFQTARHVGVEIVQNLMVDAQTTSNWFLVIAMGRKAGHLALGIGKASGATLSLIPEEFGSEGIRMRTLVDTIVGSMLKRHAEGRRHGVVVVAEGVVLGIDPADLAEVASADRDEHGNIRIAEVDFGDILKHAVTARLAEFGLKLKIVAKTIGYELRCADPIPFDMSYARDLGYCAAKFLFEGGNRAMISMQGGQFVPIPFADLLDPATGRAKIRMVDINSTGYAIARRYMIRLRRDDFESGADLDRLATAAGVSIAEFRRQFEYLVEFEPPHLVLLGGEMHAGRGPGV